MIPVELLSTGREVRVSVGVLTLKHFPLRTPKKNEKDKIKEEEEVMEV